MGSLHLGEWVPIWVTFYACNSTLEEHYEKHRNAGCQVDSSRGCGQRVMLQLQNGRVCSSQCGCNMEKQGFLETRCNPHLRAFLPPRLIRVQYPPNEYSHSSVFVRVHVGGRRWAQLGIIQDSQEKASFYSSLFIHKSVLASDFAVQTEQLISDLLIYCSK